MTFTRESAAIEARPIPTAEQHQQARRYVEEHAPDLMPMIFGTDDNQKD